MSSLSDSLFNWGNDYVDLTYNFLADDDKDYLEQKYPQFDSFSKVGCPTCEDKTCPHKTAQKCAEDCIEETCSRYKQIERTDVGCLLYTGEWDI